ncbi:SDR family NAD(P)-dependent oxidoreductase [Cryptosporangium arvum]|uniref:SDR family NAD(P)-dependent oxidoreductase n=1 Tax=Cryptosporangium arvum TaxID=80871 RepID=UPI0004BC1F56|nr:SDR family oxidoreductase [Cryptosporangium arvum]
MKDLTGKTAVVVGASRGLGRGVAVAFAESGAQVVAVARNPVALDEVATAHENIRPEVADGADPAAAWTLVDRYRPQFLVLVAGAVPVMHPLHQHTWETFSTNWHSDVKIAFHWLRESLLAPLDAGSRIVVVSSGAAVNGSPASGGYAGAKATQRFIANYAQAEADRAGLGLTITAVLPQLTSAGEVGRQGIRAYAARNDQTEVAFVSQRGPLLTPEAAGATLLDLVTADPATTAPGYVLLGEGLRPLP